MKLTAAGIRHTLLSVATGAAAALPLAVAHRWLSAGDAAQVGVIVAAVTAAWHGGAYTATTITAQTPAAVDDTPDTATHPAGVPLVLTRDRLTPTELARLTPATGAPDEHS